MTQQKHIRWDHFLRGKLSEEWSRLQDQYAKQFGLEEESKQWVVKLIKYMATNSFKLWEICNGCRHGRDAVSKQQAEHTRLIRELCTLYGHQKMVLPQHQDIFHITLEEQLKSTMSKIKTWITLNKKVIRKSVQVAKNKRN